MHVQGRGHGTTSIFRYNATGVQIVASGFQIGTTGAKQTISLVAAKAVTSPSTTDTITVPGAQFGDFVEVTRGKDAFVSGADTVTFDSTGLTGITVKANVRRFA
jgi:hypothetical protein